ncbi:MAG: lactonase family protein [Janthinobacterium lividum]
MAAIFLPLSGCANFFVNPGTTTSGTSTSTTTNSGDFVYVANSVAGTTYLSEYSIGSSVLNSLGSFSLGFIPVALAVAPSNGFLYVASAPGATSPGVYGYKISSTGQLTALSSSALATATVGAMAISPDGNWLYTVNVDGLTMMQYQVNTSTGALTSDGATTLPGTECALSAATPVTQSCSVTVSPSGAFLVASLGISGDVVYPYTSSGGISGTGAQEISSGYSVSNPTGDFSVALDANNYAYIARTSTLAVYGIGTSSIVAEGTLTPPVGSIPRSVTLSKSYNFVYTANEGTSTIAGYGISGNGALMAISGSPFTAPADVTALAADNTGNYMVAVGYDATSGVRLYSISSTTGALTPVAQAGSGTNTDYPALVAVTH